MPVVHITKSQIARLPTPPRPVIYYDAELTGFGMRFAPPSSRNPEGVRSYFVEFRPNGGGRRVATRRMVIGDAAKLDPEKARKAAKAHLARVELGADPAAERTAARKAETVEQLVQMYLDEEVGPRRKPRTLELYESYVRRHIAPRSGDDETRLLPGVIGGKKAIDLTRAEVTRFHREIGETRRMTANRCVVLIAAAFNWAIKNGVLPEDSRNPARGIGKFQENRRERFLSTEEFARLGETLRLAETTGLPWNLDPRKPKANRAPKKEENLRVVFDEWAIGALRLLIFTGCRLREILHLRWDEVDLERGMLFLPDSKTGRKSVILSAQALAILTGLNRVGIYVIAGESAGTDYEAPRADLKRPWARITAHAKLDGLRIHDLRHSFASVGAAGGLGLPIVGRLLGHKDTATTARYAHIADDPARRAADAIANAISKSMAVSSAILAEASS